MGLQAALNINGMAAQMTIEGHNVWVLTQMGPDYAMEIALIGATTPGALKYAKTLAKVESRLAARFATYTVGCALWSACED